MHVFCFCILKQLRFLFPFFFFQFCASVKCIDVELARDTKIHQILGASSLIVVLMQNDLFPQPYKSNVVSITFNIYRGSYAVILMTLDHPDVLLS